MSMCERRARGRVVHWSRLLQETWELPLEVARKHLGHVGGESAPDDHAQRREILAILREGVRGNLPAALAQGVRDVEDRDVLDTVVEREGEDGKLVAAGQQPERPHF